VRCIDRRGCAILAGALMLAGCSSSRIVSPSQGRLVEVPASAGAGAEGARSGKAARAALGPSTRLPEPRAVRNWTDVREQAAKRIVDANPHATYTGVVPEALLAIPVLEVELNGDGSVRRILVLRHPRQATDTVQLAADAVRRAAPFGDVSRLPKPWRFTETFLFDDDRRFKPRSLDP
jgi:hypothetical protein